MATTTFHPSTVANYSESVSRPSIFKKFFNWCAAQQENRLLWLGIALAGHGCIITPITVFAIVLAGVTLPLLMLALCAMSIALVTNLAALPTKITIPALLLSIIIDVAIIVICSISGFHLTNTF